MNQQYFDFTSFQSAIDAERKTRRYSWKAVSEESGVTRSTISRLSTGRRINVDNLCGLAIWAGISLKPFFIEDDDVNEPSTLTKVAIALHNDPDLNQYEVKVAETVITALYEYIKHGPAPIG